MRTSPSSRSLRPRRRTGLAPLELVLALPIMLFVMALIIDMGVVGTWKARTQINARNAAWRTIRVRSGDHADDPANWPDSASMHGGGGAAVSSVLPGWHGHADLRSPAVQGPAIVDPGTGLAIRLRHELMMDEGVHSGTARISRPLPLLEEVMPDDGRFTFDLGIPLLDNRWEFHGLGYGLNTARRGKRWYAIEPTDLGLFDLKAKLDEAHQRLIAMPNADDLDVLDRDEEFRQYTGEDPDFHPSLGGICEDDPEVIRDSRRYDRLLERITELPGSMARSFIRLYEGEIEKIEEQIPPPSDAAARIAFFQGKIDQMNRFLDALPMKHK